MILKDTRRKFYGLELCTIAQVFHYMPHLKNIFDSLDLQLHPHNYFVDVLIHDLNVGEYTSPPIWHYDFIPLSLDKTKKFPEKRTNLEIYQWSSGDPMTSFKDSNGKIYQNEPNTWFKYTQFDLHKPTESTKKCTRLFIRVAPKCLIHPKASRIGKIRTFSEKYIL